MVIALSSKFKAKKISLLQTIRPVSVHGHQSKTVDKGLRGASFLTCRSHPKWMPSGVNTLTPGFEYLTGLHLHWQCPGILKLIYSTELISINDSTQLFRSGLPVA